MEGDAGHHMREAQTKTESERRLQFNRGNLPDALPSYAPKLTSMYTQDSVLDNGSNWEPLESLAGTTERELDKIIETIALNRVVRSVAVCPGEKPLSRLEVFPDKIEFIFLET